MTKQGLLQSCKLSNAARQAEWTVRLGTEAQGCVLDTTRQAGMLRSREINAEYIVHPLHMLATRTPPPNQPTGHARMQARMQAGLLGCSIQGPCAKYPIMRVLCCQIISLDHRKPCNISRKIGEYTTQVSCLDIHMCTGIQPAEGPF